MSVLTRARRVSSDLVRRAGRRALRTRLGRQLRRPAVTVVVPLGVGTQDQAQRLTSALTSLRDQEFGDFEVLVLGTDDTSLASVAADPRFSHLPLAGTPAEMFSEAVGRARGRWIYLLRPQDQLTPRALAVLVGQARRTGSAVVCGSVEVFDAEKSTMPSWAHPVYGDARDQVSLATFAPIVRDLSPTRKLIARSALSGVAFGADLDVDGRRAVLAVLATAPTFDVVPDVVARERLDDGRAVLSQQLITHDALATELSALRLEASQMRTLPAAVRREWLLSTLQGAMVRLLSTPSAAAEDYWATLHSAVLELTADLDQQVVAQLKPGIRVLLELARQGRREDVAEFIRLDAVRGVGRFGTIVGPEGLAVQLPFRGDPELSASLFLLRPEQLTATHAIDRVEWTPDSLQMAGWAFINSLDLHETPSHVDLVLTGRQSGTVQVFAAEDAVPLASKAPVNSATADISRATFAVRVPTDELVASGADRAWDVALRITAAGFTVTTTVRQLVRSGSAGALVQHFLPDGRGLSLRWRHRQPLRLRIDPTAVTVTDLALDGARLTGRLVDPEQRISVLEFTGAGLRTAALSADGSFELEVPSAAPRTGQAVTATLGALAADGSSVRLQMATHGTAEALTAPGRDGTVLVLHRAASGAPAVATWRLGAEALEVATTAGGGLQVRGVVRASGPVGGVQLLSTATKTSSHGEVVSVAADGTFTARLDLCHDVYRYGRWPLPSGEHDLRVRFLTLDGQALAEVALRISTELNAALPIGVQTDRLEGRVLRGADGGVMLRLVRPLGAMASSYHQARLRAQAEEASTGTATHRGILFRSYFGERATDNGLSIASELARRGSDLPVYWAVQDHSVPIPPGARAVVVNSREWFQLLREVTYYVDNMYQPEYHHRPEGQVITQTFHGYPFKLMGRQNWDRLQISEAQREEYRRRGREWNYLVSPARYATELLVRDFEYSGTVLEIGYPRNDVLLGAEADGIRRATRESLGVSEDQTVVLYAPTFREARATGHSKALLDDFFDFEEFHRQFGDSAVVLMRGHAFHARTSQRVGDNGGVIDVTDYPEVADLLLAADVCVADYSSLRFDFAVTGKPLVFLVPDLAAYVADRGWLLDFDLTAPGPQVSDTAGIIEAVRDLSGVQARYADQYERFRRDFLDLEDGRAGARFVDAVIVPRGDAPA